MPGRTSRPRGRAAESGALGRGEITRYRFVASFVVLLFVLIFLRLVQVQAINASEYRELAVGQRDKTVAIPSRRGVIFDREGEQLAVSVDAQYVIANPRQVKDPASTARIIANVVGGDPAVYEEKLGRPVGYVRLTKTADFEHTQALAAQISKLKLEGISFEDQFRRVYPQGSLGCQVVGFVNDSGSGVEGLERHYDDVLAGRPGTITAEFDTRMRLIPGTVISQTQPIDGKNIILTIDKDIQHKLQRELAAAVKKWGAKGGSAVVMNPKTGEIYAMGSVPYYDPNNYSKAKQVAFRNHSVTSVYEPGSTLKALTAAAVLDKGIFKPTSKLGLPSTLRVGGRTIHEAHGRAAVKWTVTEIVTKSSNVGAVKLGQALGERNLFKYLKNFGLTEKTGIDFPGEVKGWLGTPASWSPSSLATISFGQGVSVTQLQLVRAIAAIANDGVLVTPHLVKDIPAAPELVPEHPTRIAITSKAASLTSDVLAQVVTDGTGSEAAVPGYTVAGKTGTAQKVKGGKGYAAGAYVASFIGYLPVEDPQLIVCVALDEPSNAIYGGVVAAPAFREIARFSAEHLGVKHSPMPLVKKPITRAVKPRKSVVVKPASKSGDTSVTATDE